MDLYVLADGLQVMRYAEIRGMKPYCVFWRNKSLHERMTFIGDDSALLVLIQGCTTMKAEDAASIVRMVQKEDVFKEVCVYSNIELPDLIIPYYLYSGDLFEGTEVLTFRTMPVTQGKSRRNEPQKHYINKFLAPPYLSASTEVVSMPYNAAEERIYKNDGDVRITDVNVFV